MATLMIFLSGVLIWYGTGALPSRILKKERNRMLAYGIGDKILVWVDGDAGWFPWVLLPWPFKKIEFASSWTLRIDALPEDLVKALAKLPQKNSIGNAITYSEPRKILGQNKYILTASDKSYKIRKNNRHVLSIPIRFPDSGLTFEGILRVNFLIKDPEKTLSLEENISTYTEGEVDDAMGPWFTAKEAEWKKDWQELVKQLAETTQDPNFVESLSLSTVIIRNMEKLRIDDIDKITIDGDDFRKYLNERKFGKYGFEFEEVSWVLGYGKDVEDILKERQEQQITVEKTNSAVKNEKLQAVRRQTMVNDATKKALAVQTLWVEQKKIIDDFYNAKAKVPAAYKESGIKVLVGNNDTDSLTGHMISSTLIGDIVKKEVESED